jgi:conjugal transfer pilus assembly protein TraF
VNAVASVLKIIRWSIALAWIALPPGSGANEPSPSLANPKGAPVEASPSPNPDFWRQKRDGWFWYREPPARKTEVKEKEKNKEQEKAPDKPVVMADRKSKDIEEFEEFQRQLESLRKVAIINPTPENVRSYMVLERMAYKQSTLFAEMQQSLNWVDPVFAEDIADMRPVNSIATRVWDQQRSDTKREFMARLAKTHGLYFFVRGNCPYCHAFAPQIKRFSQATGIQVFPISLDGGGNLEYPKPALDNGIAARIGIKMVPALVLAHPATNDYQIVSFGVVTDDEIMDRIYTLMSEKRAAMTAKP